MSPTFEHLFRAPYAVPNGIQLTVEGLWLVDQISDRVALVQMTASADYTVPFVLREVATQSSNTSGLTFGDGSLWLAANGNAAIWRSPRVTDAPPHEGEILRVDPADGHTIQRWPLPGGGGVHGLEYDRYEPGVLWLTTLRAQTLTKLRIADWSVQHVLPLPYPRAHGVVRVRDGIWVVHTSDRRIAKLDLTTGALLAEIVVSPGEPEPHGLSIEGDNLLYCDATSGWIVRVRL
jgi:hypothetical protein